MGKMWARGQLQLLGLMAGKRTSPAYASQRGSSPSTSRSSWGHRDVKTTLTVCAHLINTDDHAGNMAALGTIATPPKVEADNVERYGVRPLVGVVTR
jgi:hypothetical protein